MADEIKNQPEQLAQPVKIENPKLIEAIATFKAEQKRENELKFLQEMLNGRYLVPVVVEAPANEELKPGDQIKSKVGFQMLSNPKGDKFLPAFTHHEELIKNRVEEKHQVAIMTVRDFYTVFKQNESCCGFVINPFGENMCIHRQQLLTIMESAAKAQQQPQRAPSLASQVDLAVNQLNHDKEQEAILAAKASEERIAKEAEAAMAAMAGVGDSAESTATASAVAENPQELIDALSRYMKKQKSIKKAYLELVLEGTPHYLLAVECEDNQKSVFAGIVAEAKEYTDLEVTVKVPTSPAVQKLIEADKPFYEKKRFGIF